MTELVPGLDPNRVSEEAPVNSRRLSEITIEITNRDEHPANDTPDEKIARKELRKEIAEIRKRGGIVDVPFY